MILNHSAHSDHSEISRKTSVVWHGGDLNIISEKILDSAFKIHRAYGPGLLENAYQALMAYELAVNQKLIVEAQKALPLVHETIRIDIAYRLDLLVADSVIVELKACEKILPIHEAQLLTYLKLSGRRLGLVINFNAKMLKDGVRRLML